MHGENCTMKKFCYFYSYCCLLCVHYAASDWDHGGSPFCVSSSREKHRSLARGTTADTLRRSSRWASRGVCSPAQPFSSDCRCVSKGCASSEGWSGTSCASRDGLFLGCCSLPLPSCSPREHPAKTTGDAEFRDMHFWDEQHNSLRLFFRGVLMPSSASVKMLCELKSNFFFKNLKKTKQIPKRECHECESESLKKASLGHRTESETKPAK